MPLNLEPDNESAARCIPVSRPDAHYHLVQYFVGSEHTAYLFGWTL